MSGPLGLIPSWQFSADPAINPYVNPTVTMPRGMYQAGVYSEQPQLNGLNGLGGVGDFDCLGCAGSRGHYYPTTQPHSPNGLGYVMIDEPDGMPIVGPPPALGFLDIPNPFDSPLWTYRKWLMAGGVALAGLTLLSLLR